MTSKKLTLTELIDLIHLAHVRGIIDKENGFLRYVRYGFMPKTIKDTRGEAWLIIEKNGEDDYSVQQNATKRVMETINEVY